jgi:glycine cleavage system aminomethyltransferase T
MDRAMNAAVYCGREDLRLEHTAVRKVRSRLHRARGAAEEGQGTAAQESYVCLERRGHRQDICSLFVPGGEPYKFFDLPLANYASSSYDKVMMGSKTVGFSMFGGYSYNERTALSLGVVDSSVNIGDVLTLLWGEEGRGTAKPTVERHKQLELRVKVAPVSYARDAREAYHQGWRTRQA